MSRKPITSVDCDSALASFVELRDELFGELEPRVMAVEEGGRASFFAEKEIKHLRETIVQIEQGTGAEQGTWDRRLDALLLSEAVLRLRLVAPGIATITRLRDQLRREEQAAREAEEAKKMPRRYRYVGPVGRAQFDGRVLRPGDVVSLSAAQAEAWRDRFEPVKEAETPTASV